MLGIDDNTVYKIITHRSELHTVRVPPGVTIIGSSVFDCCNRLQKVVLPESIESIERCSFRWCISLESVEISSGITKIGNEVFGGNLSLRSIVVTASVATLGNHLFRLCMSLTHVSLPDSIKSIPNGAFRYCVNLTHLHLPNSVTHIDTHSFAHCVSLSNLRLPKKTQNHLGLSRLRVSSLRQISRNQVTLPRTWKSSNRQKCILRMPQLANRSSTTSQSTGLCCLGAGTKPKPQQLGKDYDRLFEKRAGTNYLLHRRGTRCQV